MKLVDEAARIELFGTEMYAFGLYAAVGALFATVALGWVCRMGNRKRGTFALLSFLSLICGAVCGRLVFCLLNTELGRMMPPDAWIRIGNGGWSLFGVSGGVFLAAWITAKLTGEPARALLDDVSCVLPLMIMAERLGESRISGFDVSRTLPDGFPQIPFLTVQDADYGVSFLATYHLAALLAAALFICMLLYILKGKRRDGDLWILFLLLCGAGGVLLESLRYDHFLEFSFVRFQQVLAAVMLAAGVALAVKRLGKAKSRLRTAALVSLALAVGAGIAIEFALDRTRISHSLLYLIMVAALAAPVIMGIRMMNKGKDTSET